MIKSHAKSYTPAPLAVGWIVTVTVMLFYMYEYILRVAPSPMIDYFISNYGASLRDIGLIDASYYWTYIPMQIIVGTLMDHYGVRKPLFLAILSCVIGSILFGFEQSISFVIVGRMLIGFGSAFGFVAVLKTASVWLPKKHFPLAVGIATSLGMLGAILSLTIITYLLNNFGPQDAIDLSTLLGIILLISSYFLVYDKRTPARKSHVSRRWKLIKKTITTVIRTPQIWLAGFIGLALYLPTQLFSGLWGIPYFTHIRNFSPVVASQLSSLLFWGWIVGSPLVGILVEYVQNRRLVILTGSILCTALLYLIIYLPVTDLNMLIPCMFILGLFSSVQILVFDIATTASKRSHAGTAVAVTNMFVMLGGPLQNLVGELIESYAQDGQIFTEMGFQQAFLIMPLMCLLAFFLSFLLKDPHEYD